VTTTTRTVRPRPTRRQQIRTFAIVWTGITLAMGACTFFAIYITYGAINQPISVADPRSVALPLATTPVPAAVVLPSATPQPTSDQPPTVTTAPTQAEPAAITGDAEETEAAVVAQAGQSPTPSPTPLPVDDRVFQVGIQVQYSPDGSRDMQELWMGEVEKLNMDWYKQQVRWEDIEPERGQYNWGLLDMALEVAAERGIRVMASVVTAPDWAREPGVDLSKHGPPADPQDFVSFVTTMLRRYPDKIHAIEVWNEQNLDREWTSVQGLSAPNYVALLQRAYRAIKDIDPGIIVISGALSPTGGWTEPDGRVSALDDFVYMDQLIAAGMLNYADCVGAHHNGYNIGPSIPWNNVPPNPAASFRGPFDNPHHSWSFYSTLTTYAEKIELAGGDQKLCVTEFGWPSTEDMDGTPPGFGFADDNTLENQRDYTVEALDLMESWGTVWLAFVWNLNYGPQAGWDASNDNVPYSIIGKDWNFRPVYGALAEWQAAYRERSGR
jgi:hypothetical protein